MAQDKGWRSVISAHRTTLTHHGGGGGTMNKWRGEARGVQQDPWQAFTTHHAIGHGLGQDAYRDTVPSLGDGGGAEGASKAARQGGSVCPSLASQARQELPRALGRHGARGGDAEGPLPRLRTKKHTGVYKNNVMHKALGRTRAHAMRNLQPQARRQVP